MGYIPKRGGTVEVSLSVHGNTCDEATYLGKEARRVVGRLDYVVEKLK